MQNFKLQKLEYANFALQAIIQDKHVETIVFYNALNGITEFLKSNLTARENLLVTQNINVFRGVSNILKQYYEGKSCIREIVEVNFKDFTELIDQFIK